MKTLQLRDIHKSFGTVEVLKGISMSLPAGELVAITGASGAGKTTLLQIMGTIERPDAGSVLYDDIDVTTLKDKKLSAFRGRHIGFVFQSHQLLPEFNALENVMLPALIAGVRRGDAARRAGELLKILGLGQRMYHKPSALSGGESQRVAVARALVNNPGIVFADEPTGSLDSQNRDEICQLFTSLHESMGQGFVIVTHDETLASIGHTVIHMKDGLLQSAPDAACAPE